LINRSLVRVVETETERPFGRREILRLNRPKPADDLRWGVEALAHESLVAKPEMRDLFRCRQGSDCLPMLVVRPRSHAQQSILTGQADRIAPRDLRDS